MYIHYVYSFDDRGQVRCKVAQALHSIEMCHRRKCSREKDQKRQVVYGQMALELLRERHAHSAACLVCMAAEAKAEAQEAA
jgi:hypothetical protein